MKKVLSLCLSFAIIFTTRAGMPAFAEEAPSVSAKSAILIDAQTGKVIFSKNSEQERSMASTTKIMTTLLCLESGDLDTEFVVDSEAIKVEGSSMGLQEGDIVTKRDLCYGMMLPSGNDAANATAVKLAGSIEAFAEMMNNRAEEIGLENTFFVTPSGLEGEGHKSTAYDMAMLTREALKNPDFAEICATKSAKLTYGNPPYDRWLTNTNKLLGLYDGCVGVKTGFTDEAGRCLVSAAERNGVELICVTLNAPDDWNDHSKLFDYGFSRVKDYGVALNNQDINVNVVGGVFDNVAVSMANDAVISFLDGDTSELEYEVVCPSYVYAPVETGDALGEVNFYCNGILANTVPLIAESDVGIEVVQREPSIIEKIKSWFSKI